jgi:CRISPR/Cas system-associated exonuclease Cas4 (RecB family)
MIEFFLLCSLYAWDPPRYGHVAFYEIYIDGRRYPEIATTNEHEICVYDDNEHTVQVVAISISGQRSEISDPSDLYRYPPTEYRVPVSYTVRADFDGDGVVGLADYGVFQALFGSCHNFGEGCQ